MGAKLLREVLSALAEVWDVETGFLEPDAELVGHLFATEKNWPTGAGGADPAARR
jgi:hypothetical protein